MYCSVLFLLVTCTLCVAQQQQNATLPVTFPARSIQGQQQGVCPAQNDRQAVRSNITGSVGNIIRQTVIPLLGNNNGNNNQITGNCPCGGPGRWNRTAYLNMSDPTQQCPTNWNLISTPVRTCGRSSTGSTTCDSAFFSTGGSSYQQVCGRIIGYQRGDPNGFLGAISGRNIEGQYVDGVSVTYGASGSRQHIWTFAGASHQSNNSGSTSSLRFVCACTNPTLNWPYQTSIGQDYFCDTGNTGGRVGSTFFANDPLWDGAGCSGGSSCCQFNTPPWFCKTLPQPTSDAIEIRLCFSNSIGDEDTPIRLIEIYTQ